MLQRLTSRTRAGSPSNTAAHVDESQQLHTGDMSKPSDGADEPTMPGHTPARWVMGRPPRVCVIGAGVAGLRCTEVLLKKGVQVTLYEGRDRVGGRVHQIPQQGHFVDMGPNWIHGTTKNPMVDLAKKTNTVTSSINDSLMMYDSHGQQFRDEAKVGELYGLVWGITSDAFKRSHEPPPIPPEKSLKDFFKDQIKERDLSQDDKTIAMQMAEQWGNFIGSSFSKQSLKFYWLEESLEGENVFVAGTYKRILEEISRSVLEASVLKPLVKVNAIKTSANSSKQGDTSVYISTTPKQPQDSEPFDAAILTASLGCLKAGAPSITPPLPARLQDAIRNLGYGNLEKAYVTFPAAFWSPQKPEDFPTFVNFLQPEYDPHNPQPDIISCMALSALPASVAHPTLLFYFHGTYAQRLVTSFATHAPGSDEYVRAVVAAFEPYFSRLPHYDAASPDCQPVAALATAWSVDKLAGQGSYTNFQIPKAPEETTAELDKDIEALRRGCPERGLWIAGEHTAPFEALGTITGAFWSGEAVANRLVDWFEGKQGGGDEQTEAE